MLADGLAVYTPGLSDHRNGASTFSHADALGSLRFLTNSSQGVTANLLSDAFGEAVASDPLATPFGWNGGSGYGTDWGGLTLVGHRYYDSRTGRFVSQDPAGDGDNWYAYCGNSPTNGADPTGLKMHSIGDGYWQDDSSGDLMYGEDGADLSGDSIYHKDGVAYIDTGTTTVHLGKGGGGTTDAGMGFGGLLGFLDSNLTFGTGAGLNRAIGAFQSGHGSGLAVAGAGLLFAGAVAVNFVPGEEEANAAVHGAEGLEALTALWHEGGEADAAMNLAKHYGKHADDVNADSLLQYARKAAAHFQNAKKGATKQAIEGATEGVIRYRKAGRAMDLAPDGSIISFF